MHICRDKIQCITSFNIYKDTITINVFRSLVIQKYIIYG